ncbi:MAG: M48 family metallopeptidase [Planctomycetota bacterium]|jgi:heat shock protein HtpX
MWEAIRANRRRSFLLISVLGGVLIVLGYMAGAAIDPDGGLIGLGIALLLWFALWLTAVTSGRGVLLGSVGARQIQHDDYPVLFNVVEEMSIAAGLPKVPKVYIMDSDAPNAFAVGTEEKSAVAVTTGLLMRLNRDELQGVVAHEIGHIRNHDTRFMMLAGVMVAAIVLLADLFLRTMFYSGGGRRRSSRRGGGGGAAVLMLVAILFAVLAPLLARLLYLACSRRREYLADASAARFSRYPEGLASALEKISAAAGQMSKVNRAVAPMFTVNPLKGSAATSFFSTHPPTESRVRVLRSMAGGAAYADYQAAYARLHGRGLIGERTLAESEATPLREPAPEPEKEGLARAREAVDILHRLGGLIFLTCVCGLRIKVPPTYERGEVRCPRCRRAIPIPVAAATAVAGALAAAEGAEASGGGRYAPTDVENLPKAAEFSYTYRPGQWQSFRCPCNWTVNLSPSFSGTHVECSGCGREIKIERA